jgi:3-dehydroquinate synthase
MMGAGKSTIGPALARRLDCAFVDTDEIIEAKAGRSIAAIFAEEGEAYFRALERSAIDQASADSAVVALGGGAFSQEGVAEDLLARGIVVFLDAPTPLILSRVGNASTRPLLAGLTAKQRAAKLDALRAARSADYAKATFSVSAEGATPEIVDRIIEALSSRATRNRGLGRPGEKDPGSMTSRTTSRKTARKSAAKPAPKTAPRKAGKPTGRGRVRKSVPVALAERSYEILIGDDWLETAGRRIGASLSAERIALITVPSVARRYAPTLTRGLEAAGSRVGRIVVPDGDATKNLGQAAELYTRFLKMGMDRQSAVVTLGGGVAGDLGGFVAATFLRGIPFVQVPTTVLAMVDASIGGKTGVNLAEGKNLVGAFHQPRGVYLDIATLRSLPPRQRAAGAAEMIKAAAIWDADFFEWLEEHIDAFMALDSKRVIHALEQACAIKAEVVARDEREGGLRRLLNFGHTLAHAIEKHAGYKGILHGEAVSIGMVFAALRSETLGFSPKGTTARLEDLLLRAGLPTNPPDRPRRAYLSAMAVDKKKQGGKIHFVVLKGIGAAGTALLSPAEIIPAGWKP